MEFLNQNEGSISIAITLVLIGIPTAARFYPPIIAETIPVQLINFWAPRIGLLFFCFSLGYYVRGLTEYQEFRLTTLVGCLEKDGVAWKGFADISEGFVKETNVKPLPLCPECRTEMQLEERMTSVQTGPMVTPEKKEYWSCPDDSCGHEAIRNNRNDIEDAEKILEKHFKKIMESEGQEYSIDNIRDSLGENVNGKGIWKKYVGIVDDSKLSTACFY